MQQSDLLIEIGTEELPPTALKTLATAFSDNIAAGFQEASLNFDSIRWFATPRRLAVRLEKIQTQQDDIVVEKRGPAVKAAFDGDGNPTKAALGWARGNGIDISQAERLVTDKGEWLLHKALVKGKNIEALVADIVSRALDKLPIPKPMRWGSGDVQFIRPIKTICILLGDTLVDGQVYGINSARKVQGHRFHGNGWTEIPSAEQYEETLEKEFVIVDFNQRQQIILEQVDKALSNLNGASADINDELLDEVTALVEWPVTLKATFDERFLAVPKEALIYTMKGDQKYFPLLDNQGNLLPEFLFVSNIESKEPRYVIEGNEKVIRPRLADAEFFFNTDKKQSLESRLESLSTVLFQKQLGTLKDKSERISSLAGVIAAKIGSNVEHAKRAGLLSKTDLMTEMVMEFTDIQGVMGMHYARIDGEVEDVAVALDEQYKPRFSGDSLPTNPTSCAVALADKLDTLTGIFGIGQIPKGDRDPFALRRAAIGLLRIIQHHNLDLDVAELVKASQALFGDKLSNDTVDTDVIAFINSRYRNLYTDLGVDISIIQSVQVCNPTKPANFDARIKGVQAFVELSEAKALAAANKRVANILAKNPTDTSSEIESSLFESDEESALYNAFNAVKSDFETSIEKGDYVNALSKLASLQVPIDAFFDNVMVMAEDEKVRNNRLRLLSLIRGSFTATADISELSI